MKRIACVVMCVLLWPAVVRAQDHAGTVAEVKAELVARGVNLLGPCGAFEITKRVAWRLRNLGYGIFSKEPGQNSCLHEPQGRFAVDVVILPNGQSFDILINSETENTPAWQPHGGAGSPASWRPAFDPGDTPLPIPVPTPVPVPVPTPVPVPPSTDLALVLMELRAFRVATMTEFADVKNRVDEPGWFTKVVKHPVFVGIASAISTWVTTRLATK